MWSITVSGTASDRATPISVPTTMPTMAPNVDTMIASHRTVRRVWRLFMPTARIRPISRVRSNTPRARVIEMPSTAMTIEKPSSTVMTTSSWLIWPSWTLAELGVGLHLGLRERSPSPPRRRRRPARRRDAVGELGDDEEVARRRRRRRLLERVERDQPVAGDRGVVVDAGHRQRRPRCRSGTSASTVSPICEVEVLGRVLVDEDAAVGQRLEAALLDVDVDELLERQRVDGAERLLRRRRPSACGAADGGDGRQLRHLLQRRRRSSAAAPWNDSSVMM